MLIKGDETRIVDPTTGGESKYANTKSYEDRGWRRPRPVHSVDPLELAWAAGLIEGEGSVWIKSGPYPAAIVQLSMTDEDVVRKLHKIFQIGDVYIQKPGVRSVKLQWKWRVSAQSHVAWVLDLLYPLMGSRRKVQIDKAREVLPEWAMK